VRSSWVESASSELMILMVVTKALTVFFSACICSLSNHSSSHETGEAASKCPHEKTYI
jgi:hypothetical protein